MVSTFGFSFVSPCIGAVQLDGGIASFRVVEGNNRTTTTRATVEFDMNGQNQVKIENSQQQDWGGAKKLSEGSGS